ncbi:MAG: GTPase Era [Rhodothermia bacterium]|nr:GTPase Era [Rhodothermia bacterium]
MEETGLMFEVSPEFRCGYVAIVGRPNAGKSTLMNALLGQKLSIVTAKAQTTRHKVLGILTNEQAQVIFLDTPGIIKPNYKLQERMMHSVQGAVMDADLVVFLVDAQQEEVRPEVLAFLKDRPAILAINKMDLVAQEKALPLVSRCLAVRNFEAVVPISALKGKQLDTLLQEIISRLPFGVPFYPPDQISEHPERFFISEIIREKIFQRFHQEVPYATQVNIVAYEEREGRADLIDAEIVVERETQKGILIGKKGSALKEVGSEARKDIEEMVGKKVFLQLHVKVRDDWRSKEHFLNAYGYRPN